MERIREILPGRPLRQLYACSSSQRWIATPWRTPARARATPKTHLNILSCIDDGFALLCIATTGSECVVGLCGRIQSRTGYALPCTRTGSSVLAQMTEKRKPKSKRGYSGLEAIKLRKLYVQNARQSEGHGQPNSQHAASNGAPQLPDPPAWGAP